MDRGEAGVLLELEPGGGGERGSSIFMKATPNLCALEKIEQRDNNLTTANTIYISHCLFADRSASMFSQRFSSYPEEITVLHAPLPLLR